MAIITMSGPSIFGADVMTRKQSAAHRRVSTTHWALLSGFRIGGMEYGYVFFEIRAFIRANPGVRPVEVRRISFFFWRRKGPEARSFFSERGARLRALSQCSFCGLLLFLKFLGHDGVDAGNGRDVHDVAHGTFDVGEVNRLVQSDLNRADDLRFAHSLNQLVSCVC